MGLPLHWLFTTLVIIIDAELLHEMPSLFHFPHINCSRDALILQIHISEAELRNVSLSKLTCRARRVKLFCCWGPVDISATAINASVAKCDCCLLLSDRICTTQRSNCNALNEKTRSSPIGVAGRNTVKLILKISADIRCVISGDLAPTVVELFGSVDWTTFLLFYAVFNYILQPTGSS